jgi:hypothetical protein
VAASDGVTIGIWMGDRRWNQALTLQASRFSANVAQSPAGDFSLLALPYVLLLYGISSISFCTVFSECGSH